MSVIVKVMGNCDTSDQNNAKPFTLHVMPDRLTTIEFNRNSLGKPTLEITVHGDKTQRFIDHPGGNVYVMDNGNTVATYAYSCGFPMVDVERMRADIKNVSYGKALEAGGYLNDKLIMALLEVRLIDRSLKRDRVIDFAQINDSQFINNIGPLLRRLFAGQFVVVYDQNEGVFRVTPYKK